MFKILQFGVQKAPQIDQKSIKMVTGWPCGRQVGQDTDFWWIFDPLRAPSGEPLGALFAKQRSEMRGSFPKPFFIDFWKRFGHPWASKSKHSVRYCHRFSENRLFQKSTPKSFPKRYLFASLWAPFSQKMWSKGGLKKTRVVHRFWDGSWEPLPLKPWQRGTGKHNAMKTEQQCVFSCWYHLWYQCSSILPADSLRCAALAADW